MRRAALVGPQRTLLREVGEPSRPQPGEVTGQVELYGVCASELPVREAGDDAPCVLGHEVVGRVVAVASDVRGLEVGQRVTGLFHEGFAEAVVAPAGRVAPVPEGLAAEVTHPQKVDPALLATFERPETLARGVVVVIEAAGTPEALVLAGELVRQHGLLAVVGYHQEGPRTVDMKLWNFKGFDLVHAHERRRDRKMTCLRHGLDLVASGGLSTAGLVTHRFPLHDVDAAFEALAAKPPGFMKAAIVPGMAA